MALNLPNRSKPVTAPVMTHRQMPRVPSLQRGLAPLRQPPHLPSADRAGTQSPYPPALGLRVPLGHTREPGQCREVTAGGRPARQRCRRGRCCPLQGKPGGEPVMPACPRLCSAIRLPLCPPAAPVPTSDDTPLSYCLIVTKLNLALTLPPSEGQGLRQQAP